MRRSILHLAMGLTILSAGRASLAAQARPVFDGTWQLASVAGDSQRVAIVAASGDAAFRTGDMGSGWGNTLSWSQRDGRLVLEYPYFAAYDLMAPLHYEFALDGREVVNEVTIGPERTRLLTRASWSGDTLMITTRQPVPREVAPAGEMAEVRRALVLASNDTLMITTTRVGVAGAPADVVHSMYVRKR